MNTLRDSAQYRPVRKSGDGRVSELAARALELLATRRSSHLVAKARWVSALRAAVIGTDPEARDGVVADMLDAGVTADEMCDLYVPAVARQLGVEWENDVLSFADVSIGTARLQSLLRDIALDPAQDPGERTCEAMIMVLANRHHSLGAMVLTGQLRRLGASVRLVLGRSDADIGQIAAESGFDVVMISVAMAEELGGVKRMVTDLRDLTNGKVPIVVGGGVMQIGEAAVRAATGADHATNDALVALKLIGHEMSPQRES